MADLKTIDLGKGRHSLSEVLKLAKNQTVLLHSSSGEDFVIEHADEFDQEVAALGRSAKFTAFLEERSKETGDLAIREVCRKGRYTARK
jgi:hypothetical protein